MTENKQEQTCQACGEKIRGRSDKKFCNDFCRNRFHNQHRPASDILLRKINHVLLNNRKIIASMIPEGEELIRISRDQLLQEGFRFSHLTHEKKNASGAVYRYCYDYGYICLDNDWILLVKKRDHDN